MSSEKTLLPKNMERNPGIYSQTPINNINALEKL